MSLKHSILALLSWGAKTGYELSKDGDGSVRFFWTATHQQVYKDLGELQKKGWVSCKEVEQDEKPDKKVYSLTKAGTDKLKKWLAEETEPGPTKDAFLVKLFVGHLAKPGVLLVDLLKQKQIHLKKKKHYQYIEEKYFRPEDKLPLRRKFQYLTLKRGLAYENMWLSWCRDVEKFLREQE